MEQTPVRVILDTIMEVDSLNDLEVIQEAIAGRISRVEYHEILRELDGVLLP